MITNGNGNKHGHSIARQRLPDERASITHKFCIAGHEGYLNVGLYPDGRPGEIFIKMSKQGSTVSGLMDGIALLTSMCLQYGVPLDVLVEKMVKTRFEPAGVTTNASISPASSVLDYVFRYLDIKFMGGESDDHDAFADGKPIAETDPQPEAETDIIANALEQASGIIKPNEPR